MKRKLFFHKKFEEAIKLGKKKQTIRLSKYNVGEKIALCVSADVHLLDVIIKEVSTIDIYNLDTIVLNGDRLSESEIKKLAINDGFISAVAFVHFFIKNYGLPFFGSLINWEEEDDN